MKYQKLFGKIGEKYGTRKKFAAAMGMSETAISRRLRGNVEWKRPEIEKACELLEIPADQVAVYFFIIDVQDCT